MNKSIPIKETPLAILLGSGVQGKNVSEVSKALVKKYLTRLVNTDYKELMKEKGIGEVKAIQLQCAFELSKRLLQTDNTKPLISSPSDLEQFLKQLNPDRQQDGSTKQMNDVWNLPLVQGKERIREENSGKAAHPAQKPEEMLKRIVLGFSNEGDNMLDPFCGSGTTVAIAKQYGRNFIGIEREERYIDIIQKRLSSYFITKTTN